MTSTSVRANFSIGIEIEFGITSPSWAAVDPVDPGTLRVVSDAAEILWDPNQTLKILLQKVKGG